MGEIRFPLASYNAKLSLARLEGSRVRLELSSLKLVMSGAVCGDEINGEAEMPGTKGRFQLVRTMTVAPESLERYVGAYRFGIYDGKSNFSPCKAPLIHKI